MFILKIQEISDGLGVAEFVGISERLEIVSRVPSNGESIWIFNLTDSLTAVRDLSLVHGTLRDEPSTEEYKVNRTFYHITNLTDS